MSENKIELNSGSIFFLVTESNVANSLSAAYCSLSVSRLKRVVFPALVYPTRATSLFRLFVLEY